MKNKYEKYIKDLKKSIKEEEDYILWLDEYTKKNPEFTDYGWKFYSGKTTKEDESNISKIWILYDIVEEYALGNNILPISTENSEQYNVKYNDAYFRIAKTETEDGHYYYCSRVTDNDEDEFIDYKKVMEEELTDNVPHVFDRLNNEIENLVQLGISKALIEKSTIKILKRH